MNPHPHMHISEYKLLLHASILFFNDLCSKKQFLYSFLRHYPYSEEGFGDREPFFSSVDQIEHLGRSYAAADTSNYGRVEYGDVVYTKSPTGLFPFGIVKQSQMQESVAVSPLYGIFIPQNYYLGKLLHYYFESPANTNNYLAPIIQKGAKNTINISNDTFLSASLCLPMDEDEQKKIVAFISAFDDKIQADLEIANAWTEIKGGLLNSMFISE